MFENFTDRARKVMALANQEAQRLNHEYIGTEHVLLGLVKEGSGIAAYTLNNLKIDMHNLRREIERLVQPGPDMVIMGKLPQTPRTKECVLAAIEIARERGDKHVGTEHLLLGLLKDRESIAAQAMANILREITLDELENRVATLCWPKDSMMKDVLKNVPEISPIWNSLKNHLSLGSGSEVEQLKPGSKYNIYSSSNSVSACLTDVLFVRCSSEGLYFKDKNSKLILINGSYIVKEV